MEPEVSGIFWVKMVTKNKVLDSTGTRFMHMRVKEPGVLIILKLAIQNL